MKRALLILFLGLAMAGAASAQVAAPSSKHKVRVNKANQTHHTIKATNPVKRLGGGIKGIFTGLGRTLDAAIVDPIGVGLQMFADFVDMNVAAPLEAMPEPLESLGDGVHYVYLGIDKIGMQLAK